MSEQFITLDFPPGFHDNGTEGQAAGRWYSGNNMRFREGMIRPIGGFTTPSLNVSGIGSISGRLPLTIASARLAVSAVEIRLVKISPSCSGVQLPA